MAFDKIIVLDDELIIRKTLEAQLRKKRYAVASAETMAQALAYLEQDQFDLMFVDVRLPDGKGTDLLERFVNQPNAPMVVIMTGFGTIESAVECMQKGAFDYIVKPCSMEQIDVVLRKAQAHAQLVKVSQYLSHQQGSGGELIGESEPMKTLGTLIRKVAVTGATVLVTGENGTGKELVAREIHRMSSLCDRPYIRVNCAAIPENLIESEFFGHEKGSFTGATERREGRFELADQGTILLDEIGEVSLSVQAKLLRVLQEQEFERVGGTKTLKVNVRVLATTNRDLQKAVKEGQFREDLYYRLNVVPLSVPALRDRKDDIKVLARSFLERLSRQHGVKLSGFTQRAQEALMAHNWPGNVRELRNTIERAVIFSEPHSLIEVNALGLPSDAQAVCEHPFHSLEKVERQHIEQALKRCAGDARAAAALLSVTPRMLTSKMRKYELDLDALVGQN